MGAAPVAPSISISRGPRVKGGLDPREVPKNGTESALLENLNLSCEKFAIRKVIMSENLSSWG